MNRNRASQRSPHVRDALVLALATVLPGRPVPGQAPPRLEMLSVGTDGSPGTHHSGSFDGTTPPRTRISADGRYVVFETNAALVCGDVDFSLFDVVVRDRLAGRTILASVAQDGGEANANSFDSVISADGRHVAFHSQATNLVAGDSNDFGDVFHRDLETGVTTLVSVSSGGERSNSISYGAAISGDGRHVAFYSGGSNLVPGDANGDWDTFVHDVAAGTTERVSVTTLGEEGRLGGTLATISDDGSRVGFISSWQLDPRHFNPAREFFVRDREAGTTTLVSLTAAGGLSNAGVYFADLSADGRHVAFQSNADNIVTPDANGNAHDIFLRDIDAGITTLVSVSSEGVQGNRDSWMPSVSADGRYVAFHSWANNLVPGDTNPDPVYDVFVRDTVLGTTRRLSVGPNGEEGDKSSTHASISRDGSLVYFESLASNLAPGDRNFFSDVFIAGPAFPGAAGPSFELELAAPGAPEGGGPAVVTVARMGSLCTQATVAYATVDGASTATAGADYTPAAGTLTFPPGVASRTFEVAIASDALDEPDESIAIALSAPTGGPLLGERSAGTLVILDDDASSPQVTLRAVQPTRVPSSGGVELLLEGSGFLSGMVPRLGGVPLLAPAMLDGDTLVGLTPELQPGALVDVEVIAADGTLLAVLRDAVEVMEPEVEPVSLLPGPQGIEGALAEGTARFTWTNPFTPRQILVKDEAGRLLRTLDGPLTALELPAGDQPEARVYLEAVFEGEARADPVEAVAARLDCGWPPPLTGADQEGEHDLALYGGGTAGSVVRCPEQLPGPGTNAIIDLAELGLKDVRAFEIDGFRPAAVGGGGALFSPQAGTLITSEVFDRFHQLEAIHPGIQELYTRRHITGFTLDQEADKLQIDAHYAMAVFEFGVALRGRLVHVFPDDGFADEFTFPEIDAGTEKGWNGITYYRAAGDVIDPAAQACGRRIPAGDYRLELFAVGGDPESPHFVFSNDGRNQEVLVAGVPCPPYPRVRVTDLTGRRTLPVITLVQGRERAFLGNPDLHVQFTAAGYWTDEVGLSHSIGPGDASYIPHDFELTWTVHTGTPPLSRVERGRNSVLLAVPRIGCYRVDVEVRDPACPRSVRSTREVPVKPISVRCTPPHRFSIINPNPDPGTIHAVVGLSDVAARGELPRRVEPITVYVVPEGCCDGSLDCEPPVLGDVQFRLARGAQRLIDIPPHRVLDLCGDVQRGPKYFQVTLELDQVPLLEGADKGVHVPVELQAKGTVEGPDAWRPVGEPMHLTNRPECLQQTHWVGSYEAATGTYRFLVRTAREGMHRFARIPDSASKQIFADIAGAFLPSFPSAVSSGLDFAIQTVNGEPWRPEQAVNALAGKVLGNQLDPSPLTAAGQKLLDQLPDEPVWQWSERKRVLEKQVQQKLFESVLWTGVIVVIPVTLWGSISLALDFNMVAFAHGKLSPFAPLRGDGHFFESTLGVESSLDVSLPAQLRADILFGIISHSLSLKTSARSGFRAGLRTIDDSTDPSLHLFAHLDVSLGMKVCMLWFYCLPELSVPLFNHTLIDHQFPPPSGAGGEEDAASGSGGGTEDEFAMHELLSGAATAVSPDRDTVLDFYFSRQSARLVGEASVWDGEQVIRSGIGFGPGYPADGPRDVAAAFIGDDRALVLFTDSFPEESVIPSPLPAGHTPTREELNELKAQDEVMAGLLELTPQGWRGLQLPRRIGDPTGVLPADRRADGRPALAGSVRYGDAIAAWVRMEAREYLVAEPGPTTIYRPVGEGEAMVLASEEHATVRPRLETAAIYTRRLGAIGPLGAARRISTGGINVEPAIAFSPSGDEAWCVWVNDAVHTDLIGTNRGRDVLCSIWRRSTDSWSAPRPVLADPDATPGVLEPSLALKADGTGLLAFNALERGASPSDTGLAGAGRFVYTCHLTGGVFGPPVLVHGLCGKRVVGRYQTISLSPLSAPFDPRGSIFKNPPEWVMTIQGSGAPGSRAGSGEVLVSVIGQGMETFSPPVSLTQDGRTHTNVLGTIFNGGLHSINLKGGFARAGLGGGAGLAATDSGYEILDHALDPDLVLASCKLSDQFPGAGALVRARVTVENRGLAGSAMDAGGSSLCGVRVVYARAGGAETVEAEAPLPVLEPGASYVVELELEMPLDPVRLRAEVFPNPGDRDATNDAHGCWLGAPAPLGLVCETFLARAAGDAGISVSLRWVNPVSYDDVSVYRDGAMVAVLPGGATSFVEHGVAAAPHTYEVRGRVGASRSARQRRTCGGEPFERFRRGDADGSLGVDISDAIRVLGFLFLGGAAPTCQDAADADDNGNLEITDAIRILGYLFLGSAAPPDPGPEACGSDPTPDALPPCAAGCG